MTNVEWQQRGLRDKIFKSNSWLPRLSLAGVTDFQSTLWAAQSSFREGIKKGAVANFKSYF